MHDRDNAELDAFPDDPRRALELQITRTQRGHRMAEPVRGTKEINSTMSASAKLVK